MLKRILIVVAVVVLAVGVGLYLQTRNQQARLDVAAVSGPNVQLTAPRKAYFPTVNTAKAVGWKAGEAPTAAAGLGVKPFATGLAHPRWLLPLANGDVLVAETDAPPKPDDTSGVRGTIQKLVMKSAGSGSKPSPNRISLLRDADGDGVAEARTVLLSGLNSPFGMALAGGQLYIADTDAVVRVPFTPGQTSVAAKPVKVVDLPGGTINHHWTKGLIASPDGKRLYVSVGSNSNVGEKGSAVEKGRAAIWEVDPATGRHRIYAYGLRNPVGLAWGPGGTLYTVVNERDELGSDIVPDYLTSVQFGGFYGWPWYYWGGTPDNRPKDPDTDELQQYVIRPDYALGPHTASLGLTTTAGARLGGRFADGMFVGQHGSWNRRPKSGYKVVFVPFQGGKPVGKPIDVLTGFLDAEEQARGRPVGVAIDRGGALLVADDVGGAVWRVTAA